MPPNDLHYLRLAIQLAHEGLRRNEGGPFGAVVVKNDRIIAQGNNQVIATNDPTAHAEIIAIRTACALLGTYQLTGCTIYASCEPCPMCLGAIYWARPDRLVFAASKEDAAELAGFDDQFIYEEMERPPELRRIQTVQLIREEGLAPFREWQDKEDKSLY